MGIMHFFKNRCNTDPNWAAAQMRRDGGVVGRSPVLSGQRLLL